MVYHIHVHVHVYLVDVINDSWNMFESFIELVTSVEHAYMYMAKFRNSTLLNTVFSWFFQNLASSSLRGYEIVQRLQLSLVAELQHHQVWIEDALYSMSISIIETY